MSHHEGVTGAPQQRNHRPVPIAARSKSKRLRTKRERNAVKFGPKVTSGGSRRGPAAPPRWLQPPPWGSLPLGSPLRAPKPVVITQNRLCHRGLFNREVKSLDVRRLLTPGPSGDGHTPTPQTEEGEVGGVLAEVLKELVTSLASILGSFGAFSGRELVSEQCRNFVAVLARHHRGLPELGVFLAHRTPAQPPGQGTPWIPRQEAQLGHAGEAINLGGWEVGDPSTRTPSSLLAVDRPPPLPHTPSPIFGVSGERETPFSWSSAKDEEDESPRGLPQNRGGPRGLLPGPPHFWRSPQSPQEEEEEENEGWAPIAPPTFSPEPPPSGPHRSREPCEPSHTLRPPRTPELWRPQIPRDTLDPYRPFWDTLRAPLDPPRPPWDLLDPPQHSPRPLWELPDPAPAPPDLPRASRALQIWSPESPRGPLSPPRPLWGPPNCPRPVRDRRPWSPDLPRAAPEPPRVPQNPQLWSPEPPRALLDAPRPLWSPPRPHWDPPDASRPLWDSPDPPRTLRDPLRYPWASQPWSPELRWDPPDSSRPLPDPSRLPRDARPWSPDAPEAPQNSEPSRCRCRQLCCDRAQRDPLRPDPLCRPIVPRGPPRHDTFRRALLRPAPLCRDIPCPDPPQRYHRPPKHRRVDRDGVREGTRRGPGDRPPSPLLPSGCGCPCRGVCCGAGFEMRRSL